MILLHVSAPTHYQGAGINAQDYFGVLLQSNAIFECGVKQKYQINSQLCSRTGHYVLSFLYNCPTAAETTKLEGFITTDVASGLRKTTVEIICMFGLMGVNWLLNPQMANCIKTVQTIGFFMLSKQF